MTIEQRLRSVQTKRADLMRWIATIAPDRVSTRPRPEKWSIQEIVEHLVLAESDVFGDLDSLAERRSRSRTLKNRLLYLVVMFILRFDIPVKVPSSGMVPSGTRSVAELTTAWESNHRLLGEWIGSADSGLLRAPLFVHPIAGPMTTTQALRMLEVHLDRHIRQIRAIAGEGGSPGPA